MYMTQDSDKTPRKRSVKKKATPKSKSEKKEKESETEDLDENDAFTIKIRAALEANLQDYAKKRNLSQKQVSAISSFVEEHLGCFIILGYTVGGDPVTVVNATTQKDSDSLSALLQKFFAKYSDPPPPMGLI